MSGTKHRASIIRNKEFGNYQQTTQFAGAVDERRKRQQLFLQLPTLVAQGHE